MFKKRYVKLFEESFTNVKLDYKPVVPEDLISELDLAIILL